jgi:hypothetical protein
MWVSSHLVHVLSNHWVRGQVKAHILGPGEGDVQVNVSNGHFFASSETILQQLVVDVGELLACSVNHVCLNFIRECRVEELTNGHVPLRCNVGERIQYLRALYEVRWVQSIILTL